MKKLFLAMPLLLSVLSFALVRAQNADRVIDDTGNVPPLVAQYGDGVVGSAVDWASDTTLAVGGTLGVWLYDISAANDDTPDAELPRHLLEHEGGVIDIAFNGDRSRMVSLAWGTARVWNMATETVIAEVPGWDAAALSADGGHVVAGDGRGGIEVWSLNELAVRVASVTIGQESQYTGDIQFSPDGTLLAASSVSFGGCGVAGVTTIQVLNFDRLLNENDRSTLLDVNSSQSYAPFSFSPDGQTLTYAIYDFIAPVYGIRSVDISTKEFADIFTTAGSMVTGLVYQASEELLFHKRYSGWWSLKNTQEPELLRETSYAPEAVLAQLSPDKKYIAEGLNYINLSYAETLDIVQTISDPVAVSGGLVFTDSLMLVPENSSAAILERLDVSEGSDFISADGSIRVRLPGLSDYYIQSAIFENAEGEILGSFTLDDPDYMAFSYALSANGSLFAGVVTNDMSCGMGKLKVWDTHSGNVVFEVSSRDGETAFYPDITMMAVTDFDRIVLYSLPDGEVIADWRAHADFISSLAFSSDGELLVSYSNDGTIRAWDVSAL